MTAPQQFTPYAADAADVIAYCRRVVDALARNNPLISAVVPRGLMRWMGNYLYTAGDRIAFLWVGEFLPADPNLPGSPPQRGFVLTRDDSRGGVVAITLYDSNPSGSPGLKQSLTVTSGDNKPLFQEARDGGRAWPQENVYMGELGADKNQWAYHNGATFDTLYEGRGNTVGNRMYYRTLCSTTNGASGEYRMRIDTPGGDILGPTHVLGVNANAVFEDSVDVSSIRGGTYTTRWDARVTNGVGEARARLISVRCYSP